MARSTKASGTFSAKLACDRVATSRSYCSAERELFLLEVSEVDGTSVPIKVAVSLRWVTTRRERRA